MTLGTRAPGWSRGASVLERAGADVANIGEERGCRPPQRHEGCGAPCPVLPDNRSATRGVGGHRYGVGPPIGDEIERVCADRCPTLLRNLPSRTCDTLLPLTLTPPAANRAVAGRHRAMNIPSPTTVRHATHHATPTHERCEPPALPPASRLVRRAPRRGREVGPICKKRPGSRG